MPFKTTTTFLHKPACESQRSASSCESRVRVRAHVRVRASSCALQARFCDARCEKGKGSSCKRTLARTRRLKSQPTARTMFRMIRRTRRAWVAPAPPPNRHITIVARAQPEVRAHASPYELMRVTCELCEPATYRTPRTAPHPTPRRRELLRARPLSLYRSGESCQSKLSAFRVAARP